MRRGTSTGTIRRRLSAAALALAAVALVIGSVGSAPAEAANACKRWGDAQPGTVKLSKVRRATRCLLNKVRARHGLGKLDANRPLKRASQRHSRYMNRHNCFAHVCSGEPTLEQRLWDAGYLVSGLLSWGWGENIAWGQGEFGTPRSIVRAWMNSSGHRRNILNSSFRDLGIGIVWGSPLKGDNNGAIYTTDFGYRFG